jgi:hypothetical protein
VAGFTGFRGFKDGGVVVVHPLILSESGFTGFKDLEDGVLVLEFCK